ncbi:MAG TPA: DUF342 domain-containing protein [Clostridiales bacterium]|nr:DUF342 domain-containing protein [Clostridiales bacterium]
MVDKNAYLQVKIKHDGTYLKLFAPTGNGKTIAYNEINNYLSKNKIHNYDFVELGKALRDFHKDVEFKILNDVINEIDEDLLIKVSDDGMRAIGKFYPPSDKGNILTKDNIITVLNQEKIKHGINEENIDSFIAKREYGKEYSLAVGTAMKQGKNARIIYHFSTDLTQKPKTKEDGSVDFHQLNIISHCKEGDLLASLIPEIPGTPGCDVYGNNRLPANVIKKKLKKGKNIIISEDGLKMIAETSGHVALEHNEVKVYNVYEIKANVDNSTGDIEYNGNISIKGNVLTGFSVIATGNIDIDGVVEGAYIEAGGHVILKRGIQGMNRGIINAQGNIVAKFIENSKVKCGGFISTESIMHSDVSAAGEINVSGRRGFVSGGKIRSGTSVTVKTVGSSMGTSTIIEVGIDPNILDEHIKLENELKVLYENKEKILQGLNQIKKRILDSGKATKDMQDYIQKLVVNNTNIEKQIKELTDKSNGLRAIMEESIGVINISGVAYPGATMIISNAIYLVKDPIQYCKLIRDGAEIKMLPL